MYGFKWGMSPPAHNIVFVSHTVLSLWRVWALGSGQGAGGGGADGRERRRTRYSRFYDYVESLRESM
jgi:hypothetical protein